MKPIYISSNTSISPILRTRVNTDPIVSTQLGTQFRGIGFGAGYTFE